MARPPRIEYEGAYYHVINRGVERRRIFCDPSDYAKFLDLCGEFKVRHRVLFHAYCLMPNHMHIFVRTMGPPLRRFMHELAGEYARYFNRTYRRVGPLFQGRYRALLVENDAHALDVVRYVHLNPVKSGLSDTPSGYRWSSYRTYVGMDRKGLVDKEEMLAYFGPGGEARIRKFREFTAQGIGSGFDPERDAKAGVVVGGGGFLEWLKREKIPRKRAEGMAKWRELQKPGVEVRDALMRRVAELTEDARLRKKLLIYGLKISTPLSLAEIAKLAGKRTITAVSQTVGRLEEDGKHDRELGGILEKLSEHCRSGQRP